MADSIYDQVLTIAPPQIKDLADDIDAYLTQEIDLEPRLFDWEDIDEHGPGLTLRFNDDAVLRGGYAAPTNHENWVGFPLFLVMVSPKGMRREQEDKDFELLKDKVRQYYHHRRRMETVDLTGVLPSTSSVDDGGPQPPRDMDFEHKIKMQTIYFWFLEPQTAGVS